MTQSVGDIYYSKDSACPALHVLQLQSVVFCFWMGGELSAIPRAEYDSYSGISHQTHNTETNK